VSNLLPTLPLNGFTKEWSDISLKESYIGELVSIACIVGKEKKFTSQFMKVFATPPPEPNQMVAIKGGVGMWSSPGQYMLLLPGENIHADTDIASRLNDTAYTTLQSDGWACLHIKGTRVFDVLERFVPLDLRGAPVNYAARTSAHHIAVIVLKFSETDIQLLTPRSSAHSFLEGLVNTVENVLNS